MGRFQENVEMELKQMKDAPGQNSVPDSQFLPMSQDDSALSTTPTQAGFRTLADAFIDILSQACGLKIQVERYLTRFAWLQSYLALSSIKPR